MAELHGCKSPGDVVRDRRTQLKMSREALAFKSGVSTSTIARLELGDRLPNVRAVQSIAGVLGIAVAAIIEPVSA